MDIVRATRDQVSHVMQHPLRAAMPIGTVSALRARLPSEIAATFDDLRLGKSSGRVMPSVASGKYSPGPGMAQPSLAMRYRPRI